MSKNGRPLLYVFLIIAGVLVFSVLAVTIGFAVADVVNQSKTASEDALDAFEIASFNNQFKALDGEQLAPNTRQMLLRVSEHNKSSEEERLISVSFLSEAPTTDSAQIEAFTEKVEDTNAYMLTLDYSENGLVSSVRIEAIEQ